MFCALCAVADRIILSVNLVTSRETREKRSIEKEAKTAQSIRTRGILFASQSAHYIFKQNVMLQPLQLKI